MKLPFLFLTLILASPVALAGQQPAAQTESAPPKSDPAAQAAPGLPAAAFSAPADTKIGPDDSVTIEALNEDDISKTWRVDSSGNINLPLIGEVHVAGLTAEQLQNKLTADLKHYIRNPQVTVYVSDFRSQPVTVAGAVHRPGTFQLEGPKSLLAVLMLAGGPDAAGPTLVVSRPVSSGQIPIAGSHLDSTGDRNTVELSVQQVLDPNSAAANLQIRPNDVISVTNKQRFVYVIGQVSHPGKIELVTQDSVSIIQVLADAGGLTNVAAPGHTELLRVTPQGLYKKVTTINLKGMMNGKQEDRLLSAGDILFVPSSTIKTLGTAVSAGAITTGLYIISRY